MSRLIPFAHAQSVFEIDPNFFETIGAKYIFLDLDNTLAPHNVLVPDERTINFVCELKNRSLIPVIISNNKEKRVKQFADACEVEYIYKTGKPFTKKLKKFIEKKGIDKNCVIMIGDQLMTDVKCAKRLKVRCILTERLWEGDQFVTKFVRWIDFIKRKKLKKDNLLIDWEEKYGRIK